MANLYKYRRARRTKKAGASPGSVVYVGSETHAAVRLKLIEYDEHSLIERELASVEECFPCRDSKQVSWINVDGVHDVKVIEAIGKHFAIHPLTLEDLANTHQRPKLEEFEQYLFVVLKMVRFDERRDEVDVEQVGVLLSHTWVLSFQENLAGDVFEPVRERIRHGRGKIRKSGPDYLLYALIDAVVDHYFFVLEKLGDRIEALEDHLISNPRPEDMQRLYKLKREVYFLRRCVWPLREVVANLTKKESDLITDATLIYMRDVYDHAIQALESIEMMRDILSELLEIYLSSVSYRMNAIMKVLTIITTIFMPLTFVAGVYGMNFQHMPELKWVYGYPLVMALMLVITISMLVFFKRLKWL